MDCVDKISVVTTATQRPELLARTYASFQQHLTDVDLRDLTLYINIDPVPEGRDAKETFETACKFFGHVVANRPKVPNFTAAINWLWSQADTPFILHLEDDWELQRDACVSDMLAMFAADSSIYQVRFKGRSHSNTPKQLALVPGIISREFFAKTAGKLDETRNPEVQIHEHFRWADWGINEVYPCAAVYSPDGKAMVRDIGRAWASDNGVSRGNCKSEFTTWV